jgi:hypothetical protein
MLIPPDDAAHFLRAYKDLLHAIAASEGKEKEDYLSARIALYEGKYRCHPPTEDEDLLRALKTACYDQFIIARHLVRCTEMVGPKDEVYRVQGLTDELRDIAPPWLWVKTAVMQFKGHWICDGLIESRNIFIGPNMRRDLSETIRNSKPKPKPKPSRKKTGRRNMSQPKEDKIREERISMEIVVDAYDSGERALGWYYYLEDKLPFPFPAKCVNVRKISPLEKGDEVKVVKMPPESECEREMFVEIKWKKKTLAVPLSQLEATNGDEETEEAIADWHYWVGRGYEF